jgi:hypothetical protein
MKIDQVDRLTFEGAMFLLFLGLRLAGIIDWPWYWLSAPLWGKGIITGILAGIKEAKKG